MRDTKISVHTNTLYKFFVTQVKCHSRVIPRGQTENAPNFRAISEIPGLLDAADTLNMNYYMLIEFL